MNLYLCLEARPIKHSFISCRLAPLPLSVIHLVLQLIFIINSLLVLIYFYTRPISSFIFSALMCPSLCLHHCVLLRQMLISVQALVRAVGSADLCCWLKPCVFEWPCMCVCVSAYLHLCVQLEDFLLCCDMDADICCHCSSLGAVIHSLLRVLELHTQSFVALLFQLRYFFYFFGSASHWFEVGVTQLIKGDVTYLWAPIRTHINEDL